MVGIQRVGIFFHTKGIVIIALGDHSGSIDQIDHITVGVEQIIISRSTRFSPDQVDAPEIVLRDGVVLNLADHIAAIQQECRPQTVRGLFRRPDALCIVGVIRVGSTRDNNHPAGQLIEAVVIVHLAAGSHASISVCNP